MNTPTQDPNEPATARVYFDALRRAETVLLTASSQKILDTLYRDPSSGVYSCVQQDIRRALKPFVLKGGS
jgi:hypothetical protein